MTRSPLKSAAVPALSSILTLTLLAISAAVQAAQPAQPSLDVGKLKLIHARLQELAESGESKRIWQSAARQLAGAEDPARISDSSWVTFQGCSRG